MTEIKYGARRCGLCDPGELCGYCRCDVENKKASMSFDVGGEKMTMSFEDAVRSLAEEDGVPVILSIPGVWEHVSEYYNNEALLVVESEKDTEEWEDDD